MLHFCTVLLTCNSQNRFLWVKGKREIHANNAVIDQKSDQAVIKKIFSSIFLKFVTTQC